METINHEYYISPEVAKLLKEAGFDFWTGFGDNLVIDRHLFPQVKWEGEEPTKVELTIKICE